MAKRRPHQQRIIFRWHVERRLSCTKEIWNEWQRASKCDWEFWNRMERGWNFCTMVEIATSREYIASNPAWWSEPRGPCQNFLQATLIKVDILQSVFQYLLDPLAFNMVQFSLLRAQQRGQNISDWQPRISRLNSLQGWLFWVRCFSKRARRVRQYSRPEIYRIGTNGGTWGWIGSRGSNE